jgi:GTP pyrophosphokinase
MHNLKDLRNKLLYLNEKDLMLIEHAFEFAKEAHGDEKRASGEPFINHCLETASTLAELKMDAPTIAAALLHDTIEDTNIKEKIILEKFGEEIAFLVSALTKLSDLLYRGQERKIENLRKMFLAMAKDIRVVIIKLADRLHNMKTLKALPKEDQLRIAKETMEIYAPLANRLGIGQIKGELEDLAFAFLYPEEYKSLLKKISGIYEAKKEYAKKVEPATTKKLTTEKIHFSEIQTRVKHLWSLNQKLKKYEGDLDKIYDLVALRIIVPTIEDCYATMGMLHKYYHPLLGRIKDYIALPKPNGYRSLHTTIFCEDGEIIEFQIRTLEMHEEAEHGIIAHWAFDEANKKNMSTPLIFRKLNWVKQLREWQQQELGTQEFLESLKIDFFKDRIFVFTPKGDVIDLPESACAVDFAYRIHSELGNQCVGAKANGKMIALSDPIKNGDIIEILIQKGKKPSRDWLRFVKTSQAREHIKKSLTPKK